MSRWAPLPTTPKKGTKNTYRAITRESKPIFPILNDRTLTIIFSYLSVKDLGRCDRVDKAWHRTLQSSLCREVWISAGREWDEDWVNLMHPLDIEESVSSDSIKDQLRIRMQWYRSPRVSLKRWLGNRTRQQVYRTLATVLLLWLFPLSVYIHVLLYDLNVLERRVMERDMPICVIGCTVTVILMLCDVVLRFLYTYTFRLFHGDGGQSSDFRKVLLWVFYALLFLAHAICMIANLSVRAEVPPIDWSRDSPVDLVTTEYGIYGSVNNLNHVARYLMNDTLPAHHCSTYIEDWFLSPLVEASIASTVLCNSSFATYALSESRGLLRDGPRHRPWQTHRSVSVDVVLPPSVANRHNGYTGSRADTIAYLLAFDISHPVSPGSAHRTWFHIPQYLDGRPQPVGLFVAFLFIYPILYVVVIACSFLSLPHPESQVTLEDKFPWLCSRVK